MPTLDVVMTLIMSRNIFEVIELKNLKKNIFWINSWVFFGIENKFWISFIEVSFLMWLKKSRISHIVLLIISQENFRFQVSQEKESKVVVACYYSGPFQSQKQLYIHKSPFIC